MTRRGVVGLGVGTVALVLTLIVGSVARSRASGEALGDRDRCRAYDGLPEGFPTSLMAGMVRIETGDIVLGSTHGYREELPAGSTHVDAFHMDATEVTYAQYDAFVRATSYVTLAERVGGAPIFMPPGEEEITTHAYAWWRNAPGASFRVPDGRGSALRPAPNEPVVQVAYEDAMAYARWLGRTLPTEAQWELAARAGRSDGALHRAPRSSEGRPLANFWQGVFPTTNNAADGFAGRAPVGCFPANAFGLYDSVGNVWEWTRDIFRGSHRDAARSAPPRERADAARVIKGGSYLCSSNFCARYRVSARHRQEADMTGVHLGFRTVRETSAADLVQR